MNNLHLVDLHLQDGEDRMAVYQTDDLEVRRMRLEPGGALPTHNANSNVLLVPLEGALRVATEGEELAAAVGQAVSVAYQTKMDVINNGDGRCTFLVLKAPHPRQMQLRSASAAETA